jgi:hypothetical protein
MLGQIPRGVSGEGQMSMSAKIRGGEKG